MSNNYRIYCCLAWKGAVSQNAELGEEVFAQLEALWGRFHPWPRSRCQLPWDFGTRCVFSIRNQVMNQNFRLSETKHFVLLRGWVCFYFFLDFFAFFFNFDGWCFVLQWVLMHVAVEQFQLSKTTTTKSNISIFLKKRLQRFQIFLKCFCFILTWHKSFVCILASAIVTAVFNECKMIRKTSFTVGYHCQQMTGERQYCNKRSDEVVHTTTDEVFLTQMPRYAFWKECIGHITW